MQSTTPLTSSQLKTARITAAQYGFIIESREDPQSLANVRLGAVGIGMILALGILAMTVGLIRGESAGELRTLTATGATSGTRRNITATTAGGLAALGAILGIAGAYIALAAGRISNLTPLPTLDLAVIAIGTPLVAGAIGWLFAGREPAVIARRPIV
jgi:putative ABC transport system permease protein